MSEGLRLSEILDCRRQIVDPRLTPNEWYYYYSMPLLDESGKPAVVQGSSVESAKFLITSGDVLISKLNPRIRRVWKVRNDNRHRSICSTDFVDAVPKVPSTQEFIYHLLSSDGVYRPLQFSAEGTTNSHVRFKQSFLLSMLLQKIPPKESWETLSAILSSLDDLIEQTEALIAKMRQVRAGMMHDLFTRGILPNGELRPPRGEAPQLYKESTLGWIPRDWEVDSWSSLTASWAMGPRFPADEYSETGNVATMRTTDIDEDGNINYESMPRANLELRGLLQHLLQPDDFVISRSGTCGVAAVFEGLETPVLPGAFLIRFRFRGRMSPFVLRDYLNSPIGGRAVFRVAEGGVQKNLRGTSLLKIGLPVPDCEEQYRMCRTLELVEAFRKIMAEELDGFYEFKSGLMHDLLTGRVRIPESMLKRAAAAT